MIILPQKEVYKALKEFYKRTPPEEIMNKDNVHQLWAMLTPDEQSRIIKIFFDKVSEDLPRAILNAIMKNV